MPSHQPPPISTIELKRREHLVKELAARLGFRGRVQYLHVLSQSGGAQFGLGRTIEEDVLAVYAEAFLRDADPRDFSLPAIVAHECGHQVIFRHRAFRVWASGNLPEAAEEVVASIIGALLVEAAEDHDALMDKAFDEAMICGLHPHRAKAFVNNLKLILEALL